MARRSSRTTGSSRRGERATGRASARHATARAEAAAAADRVLGPQDPIDAAIALAAEAGWRAVTMSEVAAAAGLGLGELYRRYPSKAALLRGFFQRLDVALLDAGPAEAEGSPRERLFEVVMRRLDLLAPHKEGVRAILRDAWADPLSALCGLAFPVRRSLDWMLAAAGLAADGIAGRLRRQGLAAIYLGTLRVWLGDDSADLSRTMAALDKRLARAEAFLQRLPARRGGSRRLAEA